MLPPRIDADRHDHNSLHAPLVNLTWVCENKGWAAPPRVQPPQRRGCEAAVESGCGKETVKSNACTAAQAAAGAASLQSGAMARVEQPGGDAHRPLSLAANNWEVDSLEQLARGITPRASAAGGLLGCPARLRSVSCGTALRQPAVGRGDHMHSNHAGRGPRSGSSGSRVLARLPSCQLSGRRVSPTRLANAGKSGR